MDNFKILSTLDGTSVLICVLIAAVAFYYLLIKKRSLKLPPGPVGLPLFGYYPFIGSNAHLKLHKLSQKYGNIFSFYLGWNLTVVVNEWTVTEELFNKTETANRPEGIFEGLPNGFGHGAANGKDWTEQRRLTVKTMRDVGLGKPEWENNLQDEVDDILQEIRNSRGQVVDIRQILSSTFTKNLLALIFGHQVPQSVVKYISGTVDYIAENFPAMAFSNYFLGLSNVLYKLGLYGSKEAELKIAEFSQFVKKYVDNETKDPKRDSESYIAIYHKEVEQQKSNPKTFITERSFYGNVQVLLIGGTETTRSATVFLIRALAMHPEVQAKIHQELDSVLGENGSVSYSERNKVPYTFSTILESLRWDTLTPVNTLRMTNEDIQIQGYDIPKGTYILMNQWALHHDPEYWPEPETFKPERFLTENGELQSKIPSYAPFSIGRRGCPGKTIALMEIFKYIVRIMQQFTILPPEDGHMQHERALGFTYQANSLKVRFIPRDKEQD